MNVLIVFLACVIVLAALCLALDRLAAPECEVCDARLMPWTTDELAAAEDGLCLTCATPPAPVPAAAQCGYYTECGNPATTVRGREQWPVCGDCAAELDARGRRVS